MFQNLPDPAVRGVDCPQPKTFLHSLKVIDVRLTFRFETPLNANRTSNGCFCETSGV